MASSNELTVMRAAGRSLARIVWGVMKPVLLVVVVVLLVAEFVNPQPSSTRTWLEQRQGEGAMLTTRSGWQFEGDSVYRFGAIRADNVVLDLTRYRFDERRLIEATHANRAHWEEGAWQLEGVTTTRIFDDRTESDYQPAAAWETALTPTQLERLLRNISQAPSELWAYAKLQSQNLQADQPLLYFWQKVLMPLTMRSLVLIAASFVFGPLRSVAAGGSLWRSDRSGVQCVQICSPRRRPSLAFPSLGGASADSCLCRGGDLFLAPKWLKAAQTHIRRIEQ